MSLHVSIKKRLKFFNLEVSFACEDEDMLVMIGPSGGGKTTIIRMIAGLETPDEGVITYRDQVWFDSSRRINIPPRKRQVGYVFQDYTLFPHLNLYRNAAFAAVDRQEVDSLLKLFKIDHLRERKPDRVSGGERQRCAICQALARRPRVMLLDEPFSALDVITRRSLREELKEFKSGLSLPIVYVTHDINEALFLADEILPIVEGRVDKEWMQKTISREPSAGITQRATREPRLSLVY